MPVPATLEELPDGVAGTAILTCITPFDTSRNAYYEAALCSGVNDWMRTGFLERDERLRGSLVLPTLDPDAAVAEIERLGGHPGFVQVLLPIRTEAPYGNPRYHRIWAAAERHGLVVGLHAWGRVGNAPTASGFTPSYLEDYASNSQIVVQAHVTSLVSEGVFERFPALRVALLECGFAWLPFLLWRFDKDWKAVWREVPWVKRRPSEYVHRHLRLTTAPAQLPADPAVLARIPDLMPVSELLDLRERLPAPARRRDRAAARPARRRRTAGDPRRQRRRALRPLMLEGFETEDVDVGEAVIHVRRGGNGPPLLLLHGYPQTHAMWHLVAPRLAETFTVVATDLRGYGDSSKPETAPDHEPYSKRAMARDQVAVMAALGFDRFAVVGHDRGARVRVPDGARPPRPRRAPCDPRRRSPRARCTGARTCGWRSAPGTGSSSPSPTTCPSGCSRPIPRASTSPPGATCSRPRRSPSTSAASATRG